MKIRIERNLYERVSACAAAVNDPVARWIALCIKEYNRGEADLSGVANREINAVATREGSVVARVNYDGEMSSELLHRILLAAVEYCEPIMLRRRYPNSLKEGRDYFVEASSQ